MSWGKTRGGRLSARGRAHRQNKSDVRKGMRILTDDATAWPRRDRGRFVRNIFGRGHTFPLD